ncbi:MAG TPA: HAD-IC family P-type ATPase, partial [Candidatus Nitrosotalea sp.]|nr:HAD-IC family P-type ATPase [Candidatus Nitrosotalea sp.]
KNANHHLARAIEVKATQEGINVSKESSAAPSTVTVGRGVTKIYNNQRVSLGNLEFIDQEINQGSSESATSRISGLLKSKRNSFQYLVNEYKDNTGRTVQIIVRQQDVDLLQFALTATFLAIDKRLVGAVFFEDSLRDDAKEAISEIKKMKIKVVMLTGDNEKIAKRIAEEVGIDEYHAELLPQDKVTKIEEIVKKHGDHNMVVMVGDGINDAPALAKSHVGIAMGKTGTDVAIETADVVLMTEDLMKIPYLIKNSRKSIFTVKQNYFGTLGVDGFGFILAFTGHINPLLAALIHVSSELVFMVNSARLILDKKSVCA